MDNNNLRVFIGYTEVAGFYSAIAKELRETGFHVKHVGGNMHKFGYSKEHTSALDRLLYLSFSRNMFAVKVLHILLREILAIFYGVIIAIRYDVFLVGYNRPCSILGLDLLLARLGGTLIITFGHHGSESRPPLLSAANYATSDTVIALKTLKNFYFCRLVTVLSDFVVTNPLYDHFFKSGNRNIFYLAFGMPANTTERKSAVTKDQNKYSIFHLPSERGLKGTSDLEKLFGEEIFVSERLQHDDALNAFMQSTVVIDQLYSDNPYPATTRENLLLGSNVIISGFDLPKLLPLTRSLGYKMGHICMPEDIRSKVHAVLRNELEISEPALEKKRVSETIKKLMSKRIDETLFYSVGAYRSYCGVGYSKENLRQKILMSPISNWLLQKLTS